MAGALTAFYNRVPVGHVEAGLRTGERYSPFPEEINRRIIGTLASWHFAPTERACRALRREGVAPSTIHLTGNTAIDALLEVCRTLPDDGPSFTENGRRLVLLTAHRRENHGRPLEGICQAVREICVRNPDVLVLYPVHLNPNVQRVVRKHLQDMPQVKLCEPLDYATFVRAMRESYLILTDSGGIQEEAPSLGKPVLVLRSATERPEGVEIGAARLVGTDTDRIVAETQRLLDDPEAYQRMAAVVNPFGDGHAAERIVDVLLRELRG
jgi:UDP-N-acetylglucosamine 2-epimerase (non-hydrolysing)